MYNKLVSGRIKPNNSYEEKHSKSLSKKLSRWVTPKYVKFLVTLIFHCMGYYLVTVLQCFVKYSI